ncbi:MAG: hypothetical protein U9N12_00350 [Euryarchaeota archaeon]|nr:hypothetical protein [Euryarchaeota archaeon]
MIYKGHGPDKWSVLYDAYATTYAYTTPTATSATSATATSATALAASTA